MEGHFDMSSNQLTAVVCAIILVQISCSLEAAEPTVLNFDELKADDVVGNVLGIYSADTYLRKGVVLTSGLCRGQPLVGKQLAVRQTYAGFEVVGGDRQPAISSPNFVIPVGGGPEGCVLMRFSAPVVRIQLTTDRFRNENRDVVRLYALKTEPGRQLFSILAVSEGADDALTEPDNHLQVKSSAPFQFALFQCTTEREGFDDLEIEWAPEAASDPAKSEK
jgi:hypothetical protein